MSSPHALILPYPAQGHVIPLMELSYCLIERGFQITFINTEFNHERISVGSILNEAKFIDGIHFVTIPDGLEPEVDRHNFGRLTTSLTTVMPSFLEELMRNKAVKFTCFIADINMAWAITIAKNAGLRTAAFWPAAAGVLVTILSIPKLIQDGVIDKNGKILMVNCSLRSWRLPPTSHDFLPRRWHAEVASPTPPARRTRVVKYRKKMRPSATPLTRFFSDSLRAHSLPLALPSSSDRKRQRELAGFFGFDVAIRLHSDDLPLLSDRKLRHFDRDKNRISRAVKITFSLCVRSSSAPPCLNDFAPSTTFSCCRIGSFDI